MVITGNWGPSIFLFCFVFFGVVFFSLLLVSSSAKLDDFLLHFFLGGGVCRSDGYLAGFEEGAAKLETVFVAFEMYQFRAASAHFSHMLGVHACVGDLLLFCVFLKPHHHHRRASVQPSLVKLSS